MKTAIEVENLHKSFGKTQAVKGISFAVAPGEIMGFLGPNGAGKTTTIRCMLDFIRPDQGEIKILGYNAQTEIEQIKSRLGFLPAEVNLYDNWTGREHINLFKQMKGVTCYEDELIAQLEYDPSKKVKNLSTGNKQKLGLILALMHNPELLILDEPTTGLDPILQQAILDILHARASQGATVFVSSHNLTEVEKLCDSVVIINQGQVETIESIANLRKKKIYTVYLSFGSNKPEKIELEGVSITQAHADALELEVKGDIKPLLDKVAGYDLKDIQITHSPLEKLFLEYYK